MEVVGVGYKAEAKGQILELSLGYSHDIHFHDTRRSEGGNQNRKKKQPRHYPYQQ